VSSMDTCITIVLISCVSHQHTLSGPQDQGKVGGSASLSVWEHRPTRQVGLRGRTGKLPAPLLRVHAVQPLRLSGLTPPPAGARASRLWMDRGSRLGHSHGHPGE
jgi:hypothetical protein